MPPYTEEEALKLNEKAVYNYEITGTSDIFISGIGFIHITSEKCNVEVQVPKPILVEKLMVLCNMTEEKALIEIKEAFTIMVN